MKRNVGFANSINLIAFERISSTFLDNHVKRHFVLLLTGIRIILSKGLVFDFGRNAGVNKIVWKLF
jgi:hypothetical protein